MTEDQFWDIVARTAQFQDNTAKQTKALENALDALPDDEIVEFEGHYAAQMNRAAFPFPGRDAARSPCEALLRRPGTPVSCRKQTGAPGLQRTTP